MNPDEIVKPGTPETAWITPDGKFITTDPAEAKANGATHQVSAANVVFADGRRQWIVFNGADRSLSPGTYSPAGPQMGYDKEQQARWTQQQGAATRGDQEGDIRGSQTGPTREVYRGGKWVVEPNPVYQPPAGSNAKEWRTEGTPLPGGGYDNSKPIMAAYVNGQRTGETRQPTAAELKDWNEAGQRTRNPGGKSDAEMAAEAERNKPTASARVGSPSGNSRQRTENGQSIKEVEYVLPDGTKEWRSQTAPTDTKDDFPGEPAGAPPLNMTPGQVADGLRQYSSYLSQQVKLWKDSGGKQGVAPEQATKLMDQRIKVAEAAGRESTNLANQQTSIYGSQINQRGQSLTDTASRRGDANQAYNNNLARFIPNITMMGAGGGKLVANALDASLGANTEYVRGWGGLRETPEVQMPGFLQSIRNASMAGIQTAANGGPVLTGPVGAAPAQSPAPGMTPAFVPRPPADPAMAAAEAARQAAAATGGATMPGTPTLAPPAAAGPAAVAPSPVPVTPIYDQGGAYNPSRAQGGNIPAGADFNVSTPPPVPAVNPINEQPITPPAVNAKPDFDSPDMTVQPLTPPSAGTAPGFQIPAPGQPWPAEQQMPVDVPYPASPGAQSQMAPSFLMGARYGQQYDPRQRAAMLGIRPDILELALAG